jgi:pyridoxal phosphate enzyme (YggS family)
MIKENLQAVHRSIEAAAAKCGRHPEDIKLVAVSKRFPPEKITEAYGAGQMLFGENYIQEVQAKRPLMPKNALVHFIGHLQSNKAKTAAQFCDMIETVDRLKLARSLNSHLAALGRTMDVLIQVNIGDDPKKEGVPPEKTGELLVEINQLPNLRVCGLMTMPPFEENPEDSRVHFRNLRLLAQELAAKQLFRVEKPELSMGMSSDFQVAIEEGATIIRVGTAIFGERTSR